MTIWLFMSNPGSKHVVSCNIAMCCHPFSIIFQWWSWTTAGRRGPRSWSQTFQAGASVENSSYSSYSRPQVWPTSERCGWVVEWFWGDKKEELLRLYKESDKAQERPRQKLEQQSKPISIIDDHHQMWDAYREKDWQEVLEHVETQVGHASPWSVILCVIARSFCGSLQLSSTIISIYLASPAPQDSSRWQILLKAMKLDEPPESVYRTVKHETTHWHTEAMSLSSKPNAFSCNVNPESINPDYQLCMGLTSQTVMNIDK